MVGRLWTNVRDDRPAGDTVASPYGLLTRRIAKASIPEGSVIGCQHECTKRARIKRQFWSRISE